MKSLKVNVLLDMLNRLLSYIFPLITFPYVARIFSPEGIGRFNFSLSIVSYFSMIAGLGIGTYSIREASSIRNDIYKLRQFSKEIFLINLLSTILSYGIFLLCLFTIPKLYENRIILLICSSSMILSLLSFEWYFIAKEEFLYITIRSIICKIFSIILLFTFVHQKTDLYKYAAISVIATGAASLFNFSYFIRKIREQVQSVPSDIAPFCIKKHMKPILIIFATIVANSLYTMLDTIMLGFMQDNQAVGLYAAASKINRIVVTLITGIGGILLPRLSYYRKNDMKAEYKELLNNSFAFSLLLSIPTVIGLEILSPEIISVFCGSEFSGALTPMAILNPIIFIIAIGNFINVQIFLPENKENYSLYIQLISGILNICLNFLLIPYFSIVGAALGSVTAEFLVTIMSICMAKRFFSLIPFISNICKYIFNSLLMGTFLYLLKAFIKYDYQKLVICIFSGAFIYGILLFIEKDSYFIKFITSLKKKNYNEI